MQKFFDFLRRRGSTTTETVGVARMIEYRHLFQIPAIRYLRLKDKNGNIQNTETDRKQ